MSINTKTYERITNEVIALLEEGTVPWRRPWACAGLPRSVSTGKVYRGFNVFLLGCKAESKGYKSNLWLTYRQALKLKGHVLKSEKGTTVIFWDWKVFSEDDSNPDAKIRRVPIMRSYTVFNLDQTTGVVLPKKLVVDPLDSHPPKGAKLVDVCEEFISNINPTPDIRHKNANRAYFRPSDDYVNVPAREGFDNTAEYYSTMFHELTHWTGHESRLNRLSGKGQFDFGNHEYSKEELVAELGASFCCGLTGVLTLDSQKNSASYIANWLKALKSDSKLIVNAGQQAQKAVDFMQGIKWENTK